MKLRDFIVPTELCNSGGTYEQNLYKNTLKTKDLVYIDDFQDIKLTLSDNLVSGIPTDYAKISGVVEDHRDLCMYYIRDPKKDTEQSIYCIGLNHFTNDMKVSYGGIGIRPSMRIDANKVVAAKNVNSDVFHIDTVKVKSGCYHTIQFGEFPNSRPIKEYKKLEEQHQKKLLKPTGKFWENFGRIHTEYKFNDKKYIKYEYQTAHHWFEVEPIKWVIKNWDELPKELNPNGTGIAKTINLISEKVITGNIPYYPNETDENRSLWQNSTVRSYLNGINVNNIKTNGKPGFSAPNGGDFRGKNNFLEEAFSEEISLSKISDKMDLDADGVKAFARKTRLQTLNPDKTPISDRRKMTTKEVVKSWIDAGQSVMLRGPSGIGKTEIIRTLYPDHIFIKFANNMFPEKVVGSVNLQTGQAIPPDFAKQALLACATDDERKQVSENIQKLFDYADQIYERSKTAKGKIVILLDEILNVKPAVQALAYTIVLNRLVETGKGLKLPANTVVVATGNQKRYSSVAEEMPEPLEKRFDHVLDMEPKVGEWIYEYAIPNKIHPSVIGYIFSKYQENKRSEEIDHMGYFYEGPEVGEENLDKNGCRGRTNDPRGWVSISNTLYAFEQDLQNGKFVGKDVENLLRLSIGSKLRQEWAEDFFEFYNNPTLTPEDIVAKNYTHDDLPNDINQKFVTLASLLSADEKQVPACREFIRNHCSPEYLSVYDIYWAGNDTKRIEKIAEIQALSQTDNTSTKDDKDLTKPDKYSSKNIADKSFE